MNSRQNRTLQALRRALTWLNMRQEELASNPAFVALIASLLDAIDRLSAAGATQERHRVGSLERTAAAQRVRNELWTYHMLPIVTIARQAAPTDPDLLADVRMPKTRRNNERLLASAGAFAEAVVSKKDVFVANGLAQDFVERLKAKTAEFRQLIDVHGATGADRGEATAAAHSIVVEGKRILRRIDNALKVTFRESDLLEGWSIAMHILSDRSKAKTPDAASAGTQESGTTAPVVSVPTVLPVLAQAV